MKKPSVYAEFGVPYEMRSIEQKIVVEAFKLLKILSSYHKSKRPIKPVAQKQLNTTGHNKTQGMGATRVRKRRRLKARV